MATDVQQQYVNVELILTWPVKLENYRAVEVPKRAAHLCVESQQRNDIEPRPDKGREGSRRG